MRAAITKCHRLRCLTTEINFLTVLEAGGSGSRSRCCRVWFLLRPSFLAFRWSSSHCVLTWPFLCVDGERERDLCCLFLFSWGHQFYWIRASTLWPHLTLITPSRPHVICVHIELQHMNFKGHNSVCYNPGSLRLPYRISPIISAQLL